MICRLVSPRVLKPKMTDLDKDLSQYFQKVLEKKVLESYFYYY